MLLDHCEYLSFLLNRQVVVVHNDLSPFSSHQKGTLPEGSVATFVEIYHGQGNCFSANKDAIPNMRIDFIILSHLPHYMMQIRSLWLDRHRHSTPGPELRREELPTYRSGSTALRVETVAGAGNLTTISFRGSPPSSTPSAPTLQISPLSFE